ncbi:hypothetical protein CEXT_798311 [Caerostris extrusa]|uniref:Uncharacterized protein n=1 Tax=Caerostris extrusa TaxID=172846 RepID=A0AAV4TRY6_CAEEX|nr:hypothetical protein CEXT_798311 [Caerostris extrusa]
MFPAHSLTASRIRQLVQILYSLKDDNFTAQKATDQLLAESGRIELKRKVEALEATVSRYSIPHLPNFVGFLRWILSPSRYLYCWGGNRLSEAFSILLLMKSRQWKPRLRPA